MLRNKPLFLSFTEIHHVYDNLQIYARAKQVPFAFSRLINVEVDLSP